jgi:hypothetical protein
MLPGRVYQKFFRRLGQERIRPYRQFIHEKTSDPFRI